MSVTGGMLLGGSLSRCRARLSLDKGFRPLATQLHELGAVDHALPAVRHQPGLGVAPLDERTGPLLGTLDVEDLVAGSR